MKPDDELNPRHVKQIIRRKMLQKNHGDNTQYKRDKKWLKNINPDDNEL
jgi:hypothetical protein